VSYTSPGCIVVSVRSVVACMLEDIVMF
jgi:hypothetical protein